MTALEAFELTKQFTPEGELNNTYMAIEKAARKGLCAVTKCIIHARNVDNLKVDGFAVEKMSPNGELYSIDWSNVKA